MLDEKQTFHPYGAWLCLYFVATTISPLRGYDQSGLTVGSEAVANRTPCFLVLTMLKSALINY
jgi:hypothetical protein